MAEPFKNLISPEAVRRLASEIAATDPRFDAAGFTAAAVDGLDAYELKGRVRHVALALRARLAPDWPTAVATLIRALPPPIGDNDAGGSFHLWPVLHVVEEFGADDPDRSLPALHAMTQRWSAEFAIRPLIVRHPDAVWRTLAAWARDASPHVRRLVSEGTRPRLPWGLRLQDGVRDPTKGLAILEMLLDDPSEYVRRSVANHLGDVAKDHPDLAVAVATRWWSAGEGSPTRRRLVTHALRGLLKAGHPGALALIGHAAPGLSVTQLNVSPTHALSGGEVEVHALISAPTGCLARVDVAWSWPGARGGWSSRTFRASTRQLAAGETWAFTYRLSLREVTTRPLRVGVQRVVLRVNGVDHGPVEFELQGRGEA